MKEGIIYLYTNAESFAAELIDVAKLFIVNREIKFTGEMGDADIAHFAQEEGETLYNRCIFNNAAERRTDSLSKDLSALERKRYAKRYAKLCLYNCLKKVFPAAYLPWGALTGIRPSKLAYEIEEREGVNFRQVFSDIFDVKENKIDLIADILDMQKGLRQSGEKDIDFYVGIPFCTSRCSYCSFTGGELSKLKQFVQPFVKLLKYEIERAKNYLTDKGYTVKNVYFGGGTPTSLPTEDLQSILQLFDFCKGEFTVEAGRPDTIDELKLNIFKQCGVNRISINPQSFNQKTLDLVGRKHSVEDVYEKFYLAREFGFDINMDLIAGLPQEEERDFDFSLYSALKLKPENITVHSLALKRGSILKINDALVSVENTVAEMIENARAKLYKEGYKPYYLYRQKYVSSALENVGYCLPNKQCKYNINNMEEISSVVACGCGAISKKVYAAQSRIERQANPKDVKTYIENLEEYIKNKERLFDVYTK